MSSIYLIGSLRNPAIPAIGQRLREVGWDVFDDWFAGGPEADDKWKEYEQARGHSYTEALEGYAAGHVYWFDREHLDRCDAALLVSPAGRSAHLELGYMAGKGRKTYILLEPDTDPRWDVMMKFATKVFSNQEEMIACLDMRRSLTVQVGLTGVETDLDVYRSQKAAPPGGATMTERWVWTPSHLVPPIQRIGQVITKHL